MSQQVKISEVMKDIVAKVSAKKLSYLQTIDPLITGVHFEYGHYTDIRERLIAKDKIADPGKYPLVCMFEDFRVRKGTAGLTGIADLKMIILYYSKKDITRQQREDTVFTPILYPVYYELLRQINVSGKFMVYSQDQIKHDMIARPHWGDPALYANAAYLFGDVLDGIELNNLQLTTFLDNCLAA